MNQVFKDVNLKKIVAKVFLCISVWTIDVIHSKATYQIWQKAFKFSMISFEPIAFCSVISKLLVRFSFLKKNLH